MVTGEDHNNNYVNTRYCRFEITGACHDFHQSVGFHNLWFGYLILVAFCLLLAASYSFLICYKFSHLRYILKWHIGLLLINITIWFWVPAFIFNEICQINLLCGLYVFAIPLAVVCFILSLLELYYSPDAKFFRSQKSAEETEQFLKNLKAATPRIGVKIVCFHYEMRGKWTVEKATFKERRYFPITGFLDASQTPSILSRSGVTLLQIYKSMGPGDAYSQNAFNQFKNRYIAANSHRDQAMHTKIEVNIPGLDTDKSNTVMTFIGKPPWWANKWCFYILSFLHLSIILRIIFRTQATSFSILIKKIYFVEQAGHLTYDFDTGVVGPPMSHQQGHGQPQHLGHFPAPTQFGQPGFAAYPTHHRGDRQENQQFINPETQVDDLPPTYEEHHKFTAIS